MFIYICVKNTVNFVLQIPPTVLLLLYEKFIDTLTAYLSHSSHSFQPSTPDGYLALNLENFCYIVCFCQSTTRVKSHPVIALVLSCFLSGGGVQLGSLEDCSIEQYAALKNHAVHPSAYGGVQNWSAADVMELKNILGKLYSTILHWIFISLLDSSPLTSQNPEFWLLKR